MESNENFGYIYKTINLINNKVYIGQKKSITFLGDKYLGSGKKLRRAINKYGKDNFKVELIEFCNSKPELDKQEIYWINYYNSINNSIGYNIAKGGEGSNGGMFKGHKHSEITKQKISAALTKYNALHTKE